MINVTTIRRQSIDSVFCRAAVSHQKAFQCNSLVTSEVYSSVQCFSFMSAQVNCFMAFMFLNS
jgi:hypothetical protein